MVYYILENKIDLSQTIPVDSLTKEKIIDLYFSFFLFSYMNHMTVKEVGLDENLIAYSSLLSLSRAQKNLLLKTPFFIIVKFK